MPTLLVLFAAFLHAHAEAPQKPVPGATPAPAPFALDRAIQFPVEKYSLPNGLDVLLHPDNTIPSVSVQTWYRVGSKDEVPGKTGLAHFFEHMMFKGTHAHPAETWNKTLNAMGCDLNAFTSNDYTGYFINGPAETLDFLLRIESDRMRNLKLDPGDVAREREVVKEERRMRYEDSIEGSVREKMAGLLWSALPYRWLPIGSMEDLNRATMADLRAFYQEFYAPNNAVLVVAGAIDPVAVKAMVQKYYGPYARETITRPTITPEPAQTRARGGVLEREAQAPSVEIAYHLPDLENPDHYALDLLSIVLGGGNASRLHQELVYRQEAALSCDASSMGQALAGEFVIFAQLKPDGQAKRVATLIEAQVQNLRDHLVGQRELDRARNVLMKDYVDGLKRMSGRARMLANYEILHGDYTRIFTDLKKYEDVTREDLRRVAGRYLKPNQRTTETVVPTTARGSK